ncbi:MAG: outer membrane protein transport protein [Syntrophobacterales bacterium]
MTERSLYNKALAPEAHHPRFKNDTDPGGRMMVFLAAIVLALFCAWPTASRGAGFALIQQGTAAMAQGNAFVAEADDPSAIFYNPAGLNQIKRPQAYVATFLNFPDREFKGLGGTDSETKPRLYHTGAFYLVYPANERVALGLGYFSPFGLGTDWPADWAGRYITTFSQLKTYTLNPVISLKLTDNLPVAGGVNFLYSDVKITRKFPIIPQPLLDGKSDIEGSGTGFGANFGVLYEPVEGLKFGLAYRSPIEVDHGGRLVLSFPAFLRGQLPRSVEGSAKILYPPSLTFGVSISRFKPFTFNVDATWTGWSTYQDLTIKLDQTILVNGRPTSAIVTEKNWHDTWALRFGAGWQVKENIKIRAGYTFDMTPVPASTLEPQVPDSNRHIFAVGSELKIWRLTLAFAYNFILNESRDKDNFYTINGVPLPAPDQANGTYRSHTHSLGLSTTFHF